ncbi:hypothetical protein C8F01DRAFT_48030 [Mycena amicta]|nr:hypothetical protein C8F01DRAFT_48030 [Mycena amicta]
MGASTGSLALSMVLTIAQAADLRTAAALRTIFERERGRLGGRGASQSGRSSRKQKRIDLCNLPKHISLRHRGLQDQRQTTLFLSRCQGVVSSFGNPILRRSIIVSSPSERTAKREAASTCCFSVAEQPYRQR